VTQFLDLAASQRLVIHDEGLSGQSPPRPPVPDDIVKFSDNFANLVQEQKRAKKYSLCDNDGLRTEGSLRRLSGGQGHSAEGAVLWPRQEQGSHVEIKEKEDMEQNSVNRESGIMNIKLLRNVVGGSREIVLGIKGNAIQDPIQKFGVLQYDEGWIPETCEETHEVAEGSRCGTQQRRWKTGPACDPLNIQHMVRKLRQQVERTERVVAVLNCQGCEQTRHLPHKGGITSEALAGVNCHRCETQEGELERRPQDGIVSCGAESSRGGTDCCNLQNCPSWTGNGDTLSGSVLDTSRSSQNEVQELYPPRKYTSESGSCRCVVSGNCRVNRLKQGAHLVPAGDSNGPVRCCSTTVRHSGPETGAGGPSSVQGSLLHHQHQRQKVFTVCEQREFEPSKAVSQVSATDGDVRHAPDGRTTSACRCRQWQLDRDVFGVGNQISVQIPGGVTTGNEPHCGSSGMHVYVQNGRHGNTVLRSLSRRHIHGQQSVQLKGVDQADGEQSVGQTRELDQRVLCASSSVSDRISPRCQTSYQLTSEERISRPGIVLGDRIQTEYEQKTRVCQRCGLEISVFETVTREGSTVPVVKCEEDAVRCQDCHLKIHSSPEVDGANACGRCAADGSGREPEDGGHRKKKRVVALWQRLLRKHATYGGSGGSGRRKLTSVAAARPTLSPSRP
jgi:hypothetical protein